jgi:hypothetical protein
MSYLQLSITPGNTQVTANLSWSGAVPNGLIEYIICYYQSGSQQIKVVSTTSLSVIITGLTNNVTYNFQASPYLGGYLNGTALSETSIVQALPSTVPTTPANFAAVVSQMGAIISQQVNLSWSASSTNGNYTSLTYNIYQSTDNVNFSNVAQTSNLSISITGLTNGTEYYFKVSCSNTIGESALSSAVSAIPLGLASAPLSLLVAYDASVSNKVNLSYNAPSSNGGTAVLNYTIRYSLDPSFMSGINTITANSTTDSIINSSFTVPYADQSTTTG